MWEAPTGRMAPERTAKAAAQRGLDLPVQQPGDLEAIVRPVGAVLDQRGEMRAERAPGGQARLHGVAESEVEADVGDTGLGHEQIPDEGFRLGPRAEVARGRSPS